MLWSPKRTNAHKTNLNPLLSNLVQVFHRVYALLNREEVQEMVISNSNNQYLALVLNPTLLKDAELDVQSEQSDEDDDGKKKKKENIWLVTLYECAGGSTLHGVSHICYPGRIGFKKIIWLWVFCVAMFYFVRHTRESVIKYFEYPHITGN